MKRLLSLLIVTLFLVIFGARPAHAEDVQIGVQVIDMYDVNFPENEVKVDFYIWCSYNQDPPMKVDVIRELEFINAKEETVQVIADSGTRGRFQMARVRAVIRKNWTIVDYPFDEHTIRIQVQAPPGRDWKLVQDDGSAVDQGIKVAGWEIQPLKVKASPKKYAGSFGEGIEQNLSRLEASFMIKRPGGGFGLFLRSFVVLFVAVAIALMTNLIKPMELEVRSALGVGSLFAAVGSQFVFSSMLPESNMPTLFDRLHAMSYGVIFLTVIVTVWSYRVAERGNEARAIQVDKVALWTLALAYLAGVAWLVMSSFSANVQTLSV